ncbi:MAG: indolepyruvate oxidoreductase subunit beta [Oscillospiraceae bacterium]|nr:indolepyruvate oxidoreductase subunit beta [Oscillospiraceae bacterium]
MTKNIMIVGVGGQGTLLTGKILGNALLAMGYDVKVSEVHGMAQRGGAVVTYVRYGKEVFSPVINEGEADIILAFEQLEAARWLSYLKKDGCIVINMQRINPMPVITGVAEYPQDLLDKIKSMANEVIAEDALAIAKQAGNIKAVNVSLLGVAAKKLDIDYDVWVETIKKVVPAKFVDLNLKAFELGCGV